MTSAVSLIKKITGVKCTQIDSVTPVLEKKQVNHETFVQEAFYVKVRPWKRISRQCPVCHKTCPGYDTVRDTESRWRGPSLNGIPVYLCYNPRRIECPEHGVKTEYIPWADGTSRFLEAFNNEVTFLSLTSPKTVVSEYLDINWRTVGNCLKACHDRLEPDVHSRMNNVRYICVDETSYKKGHKYITVVVDIETGQVLWIHEDRGNEIFREFCESLTQEERDRITIVAGDGASWISTQTQAYFPNAIRCMDPFHVVSWVTEALDDVRASVSGKARREAAKEKEKLENEAQMKHLAWMADYERYLAYVEELKSFAGKRGRTSKHEKEMAEYVASFEAEYGETMELLRKQQKGTLTDEQTNRLKELEEKATKIKGCKYALVMNPEHLNAMNRDRIELIKATSPELYKAYMLKEEIRVIVHMKDYQTAKEALEAWIKKAQESGFPSFVTLAEKISKKKEYILNSVKTGANSSKSEQTNGLIKGLIRTAKGFRNMENMFALIYLRCSDLVIPLNNRYRPSVSKIRELRAHAAELRKKREEAKKNALIA